MAALRRVINENLPSTVLIGTVLSLEGRGQSRRQKCIRSARPVTSHGLATAALYEHHGCTLTDFHIDVSDRKLPGNSVAARPVSCSLGSTTVQRTRSEARGHSSGPRWLLTSASAANSRKGCLAYRGKHGQAFARTPLRVNLDSRRQCDHSKAMPVSLLRCRKLWRRNTCCFFECDR